MFKQTFAAFVTISGLSGAAAAQTDAAPAPQTAVDQALAARTCALPKIAATVPLQPIASSGLMTVAVAINGTTKQFLLDIGMNPTEISQQAVTDLGLPANHKGTELLQYGRGASSSAPYLGPQVSIYDVRDGAGAGALQDSVRLRSFAIGDATTHNMQLRVSKDIDMGRSEPYDGLLTGDFLKQYDIELDFGGRKAVFLTPTGCADSDQSVLWPHSHVTTLPVTVADDGKLQVQMRVKGNLIHGEIDTSSPYTVMRRDIAELMLGLKPDTDMMPYGSLKDGMGQPVYAVRVPQIVFPGFTAVNVTVLIETNSLIRKQDKEKALGSKAQLTDARLPDFTIGMDVLQHLHMYTMPDQGKIYVTVAEAS